MREFGRLRENVYSGLLILSLTEDWYCQDVDSPGRQGWRACESGVLEVGAGPRGLLAHGPGLGSGSDNTNGAESYKCGCCMHDDTIALTRRVCLG